MDGPVKNPKRTALKTNSPLKFRKFKAQCSSQGKVALVQVDYENEAGRVKILKIQTLSRCNEGTFVDGPLQHPIVQTVIFVIETISLLKVQQVKGSL